MSKLLSDFDALLDHLNSEDNGMAIRLRSKLESYIKTAEDDAIWRGCLEGGGVDNWEGYSDSLHEGGYCSEEDEDDE